ncbi:hypothetical protein LTR37_008212 [Vermiconidia calcicola]|uniref:Uncharacterized protein n=1 Tax=Vermiconidia calcicola TaxID=1690605 RepID=A0ACC3NBT6_9PEZI|nr:hypothetical protein LTR37_008212 [Vermiconidia calcicola]
MATTPYPSTPIDFARQLDPSILKGRTALVTGGASGIGLSIVTALAEVGAHVTLVDIDASKGASVTETLKAQGLHVIFAEADVTSWESQAKAFQRALRISPQQTIDIVVAAAGIRTQYASCFPVESELATEKSEPKRPPTATIDVNLTGTYFTMSLAQHYFARSPPHPAKQMLFIASMAAYNQSTDPALSFDYSASKFGVRGLFHQVRRPELAATRFGGARFNLLAPFFIASPMCPPEEVEALVKEGWKVGDVEDVREGAKRCLTDHSIRGRVVVCCSGKGNGGGFGDANFDAGDDLDGGFGVPAVVERKGWFGSLEATAKVSS